MVYFHRGADVFREVYVDTERAGHRRPKGCSVCKRHEIAILVVFSYPPAPLVPEHRQSVQAEGVITMKLIVAISMVLCITVGCSWVSNSERANLTHPDSREEYIALHPGGEYNVNIRNGEITQGMNTNEVMASWGYPNVYLTSKSDPREHWIYYVQNEDSKSYLIYSLNFKGASLVGWDIDIKRFGDYSSGGEFNVTREQPADERSVVSKQ